MHLYLSERALCVRTALENKWYPSDEAGDTLPRIVIPATSGIPGNVYWQARAMVATEKRYQSPCAPRGDAIIVVWGHPPCHEEIVLVEGPMDALAAAEFGYTSVALMGGTPPEAIALISRMHTLSHSFVVVPDRDDMALMLNAAVAMLDLGHRVRVVDPYPAKDLAALSRSERLGRLA